MAQEFLGETTFPANAKKYTQKSFIYINLPQGESKARIQQCSRIYTVHTRVRASESFGLEEQ